jgi:protein SCO1/2
MTPVRFCKVFLVVSFVAALAACSPPAKFKSTDVSGVDWGGDFTFTAHTGQRVKASDYRGKLVVLFFGYTHCPDICAPTLAKLAQAVQQLGDQAAAVQVLFVTVDPGHDTPEKLAAFIPRFHPAFLGLTGTPAEIAAVAADYKVGFQANPAGTETTPRVDHAGSLMIKDRSGKLRLLARNDTSVADLAHDLRLLLK